MWGARVHPVMVLSWASQRYPNPCACGVTVATWREGLGFRGREFDTSLLEVFVVWFGPDPFIVLVGLPSFLSCCLKLGLHPSLP